MIEDKKLKNYVLLMSIILFAASLPQKSYCTTSTCSDSIMVFLLGWAAIMYDIAGLIWFVNPLLLIAWFTLRKKLKASMFLSMAAALLSLSFLLVGNIIDNEAGHHNQIVSYRLGYWLWLGSSLTMLIGTYTLMFRYNNRNSHKATWNKKFIR